MSPAIEKSALMKECYNYALSLLARRDYSKVELKQRMDKRYGLDDEVYDSVLHKLEQSGYQSDSRYAQAYVRYRSERGFGPKRLQLELAEQGVDSATIEEALNNNTGSVDWDAVIYRVWQKKFHEVPRDWQDKAKQLRFLSYRGFEPEHIERFLEALHERELDTQI